MLQNCSIIRVAEVFFNEPGKNHYLKEISTKSNLAHTSVKTYLEILKKEGIIKDGVEKRGKRDFPVYSAEIRSESYKKQKMIINLFKLLDSCLIEHIIDEIMPNTIILFGSYSRGEDTEESDIDLFVEAKKQELDVKKFEDKLNRKIQVHFKKDINLFPKELKNSILNGFTLFGSVDVFK